MTGASEGHNEKLGTRRVLAACCVLLVVCSLLSVGDFLGQVYAKTASPDDDVALVTFADIVSILASILLCLTAERGVALLRCASADNSRLANACQSLALGAGGMSLTHWVASDFALGNFSYPKLAILVGTCTVSAVFYVCCARLERTDFWEVLSGDVAPCPASAHGTLARHLALDPVRGRLRPLHAGEEPSLLILDQQEFLDGLKASVAERVTLAGTSRCQCLMLGDAVWGCVRIPSVALPVCDLPSDEDVTLSFYFADDVLRLALDQSEGASSLVARSFVDQHLMKQSALTFIPEMLGLLMASAPEWLRDARERLVLLEDSLATDVMEMPRGFFEYISHTRRRLHLIQSFFEQLAELLNDLTDICEAREELDIAQRCEILTRRADRLADEAEDLHEYAAEIRQSYQERIDVRQNYVMSLLTVVTTVLTPLSIVTGWYGMNFRRMPELYIRDAYPTLIACMVLLVSLEVAFFKRRRWF